MLNGSPERMPNLHVIKHGKSSGWLFWRRGIYSVYTQNPDGTGNEIWKGCARNHKGAIEVAKAFSSTTRTVSSEYPEPGLPLTNRFLGQGPHLSAIRGVESRGILFWRWQEYRVFKKEQDGTKVEVLSGFFRNHTAAMKAANEMVSTRYPESRLPSEEALQGSRIQLV